MRLCVSRKELRCLWEKKTDKLKNLQTQDVEIPVLWTIHAVLLVYKNICASHYVRASKCDSEDKTEAKKRSRYLGKGANYGTHEVSEPKDPQGRRRHF